MSTYIPIGVISQILCKLDVKTIIRFRCVSKEWCSLINSNDFIYTHLNHSIQTIALLVEMETLYTINFDTLCTGKPITLQDQPIVPRQSRGIFFIGSCNGLICLLNAIGDFLVLNPSLKKYKQLLATVTNVEEGDHDFGLGYGFGYDAVSQDYKLVKIIRGPGLSFGKSEMGIYSLMKDSYEIIPMPYYLHYNYSYGVYVGGALHWFVNKIHDTIVGFDLGVHEFREVGQPDYGDNVDDRKLYVFDGCLCVVARVRGERFDVWVMKKYGVQESWSKVFTVSSSRFDDIKPLGYSRNCGEVLLEVDFSSLVWYDIEKRSVLDIVLEDGEVEFRTILCSSSLVPPKQGQPPEEEKIITRKNAWRGFKLDY